MDSYSQQNSEAFPPTIWSPSMENRTLQSSTVVLPPLTTSYGNSSSSSSSLSAPTSLMPPSPKSPPGFPDLYGKRRQLAKVQVLEREISILEEELKSIEGLQLASRCCKELDDFIGGKLDPFMAIDQKTNNSSIFWKRLWRKFRCRFPRLCCFYGSLHLNMQICCACCRSSEHGSCMQKKSCQSCCSYLDLSCSGCTCSGFKSFFRTCKMVKLCCNCTKASCCPCCLYY